MSTTTDPTDPIDPARPRGPHVVAHRGYSAEEPEHTLAAYLLAIEAGADALETDVRLTADGHLVCVHDRTVDRTSDGRGVISTLELAELQELDFGSWKDRWDDWEDPPMMRDERNRVLTLPTLLTAVRDSRREVTVAIETKHPTRFAGYLETRLVETLEEFGWARPATPEESRVRVMSFSSMALKRVHRLAPTLPTVFLMEDVPLRYRTGVLPPRVGVAGPSIDVLRRHPSYVARVHAAGNRLHVWTVDEPEDIALALDLGVDAIITNRPSRVLAARRARFGPAAAG
jgi:glycerophosphoryl diester phosphodiesterase